MSKRFDPAYAQISGYIPKELARQFKMACAARETSQSEAVEQMIALWLEKPEATPVYTSLSDLVNHYCEQLKLTRISSDRLTAIRDGAKPTAVEQVYIGSVCGDVDLVVDLTDRISAPEEKVQSKTMAPMAPELRNYLPCGWVVTPTVAGLRLLALSQQSAEQFLELSIAKLILSANHLSTAIEIAWKGCETPLRISPKMVASNQRLAKNQANPYASKLFPMPPLHCPALSLTGMQSIALQTPSTLPNCAINTICI